MKHPREDDSGNHEVTMYHGWRIFQMGGVTGYDKWVVKYSW